MRTHSLTVYAVSLFIMTATAALMIGCSKELPQLRTNATANALSPAIIASHDPEALFLQNADNDPRMLNRSWEGIPSIGATDNAREIYVAWYSGGKGEGPGNYITVAISRDNARHWKRDALVVYPRDTAHVRMYDPALWRNKSGAVMLTWTKSHQYWDGIGGVWTMPLSYNGGNVVPGQVSLLAGGVMLNKPAYIPSSETMLFPISWWPFAPADPARQGAYIYSGVYKRGSAQLEPVQVLSKILIPDSIRTFDEHQLVETSAGHLLCLVRTSKGIYYTNSSDDGAHWAPVMPFTAVGASAASRFHISKLSSGRLLLIINNNMARTDLTAFLSANGGKTWKHKLVIDRRSNVSYPDAIQTSNGYIHVVYDRDRFTSKDILYCRFTESDVLSANEKGIVRAKVNK
jgi:hypothetical protein